ncbi:salt tolerance down-regulator-domain-containing protein [Colletotrichum navitas]|uniref:Stress response protein NST1 n=1 Tax=Colletotrichum navitas TaxID=681940 RepID=A0AAD8V1T6_9PEZI|nr:salt tolerance down-regulator-domain-containing protein [Colletotrichum navitas]KAK1585681.1 salt tolerance down-regulator-domain-containing protein [Colletotrichum navitas]
MPANHRQPASQTPASPNTKATARYTNKDGSKIITVPKGPPSTEPSQPSTPTLSARPPSVQTAATNGADSSVPTVNRKKQKRRAKAAAKAAAEQAVAQNPNGRSSPASGTPGAPASKPQLAQDDDDQDSSDDDADEHHDPDGHSRVNGVASAKSSKKSKKKKKKNAKNQHLAEPHFDNVPSHSHSPLTPRGPGISKDKIWNTSSQEERERIKEFWLGLGEDERKSLVKVEKDAVLKKMKEQQKHTCSCTVCGRKRTAIEEELEGLYDAYYEELETFANNGEGPHILPPHREFPLRPSRLPATYSGQPPSRGRIVEHVGDDDEDEDPEEEYSDEEDELEDEEEEEDDDEYSEEDEPPEDAHPHDRDVADFLTFGNSLQVKGMQLLDSLLCRYGNMDLGGILTVADDLLKNDGKRFIEMMEQLAERRMAREEDAKEHFSRAYGHPANGSYSNHNHPPPEDDYDDEDEEEDEDYDDSQEEEYEDEEVSSSQYTYDHKHSSTEHYCCHHQDTMTEEQRMEEGRRMFQIFAARMFEQRVLTAYRDMVAKQRQQQLIEELEEENRQDAQRKAKKAKENQKRKDKAALKKQQQAEEKARKEAEKAAEEAARLEEQRRKAEEQRLRAEEKRRKKEEQKRLEEEERLRKEAERQKRLQEQQEKRAEQERKAREAREKAQKLKEEARLREKENREQKEKEMRERKEKQDQAKRDKEAKAKAEREAKADKESSERLKQEEKAAQKAATIAAAPIPIPNSGRRPSQHPVPIPTHTSNPASYASPKIPVATPALPKAPTPIRPKHASQPLETSLPGSQASQSGSTASQNPSPHPATPGHTSPAPIGSRKTSVATTSSLPHPHSVSPSSIKGPMQAGPFGMPMSMPPPGFGGPPPPGLANRIHDPIFGPPGIPGFGRPPPPPGMMPCPPGLNGPAGRGFMPHPPPGFGQPMGGDPMHNMAPGPATHSRQASGSFDPASSPAPAQPIGRPAPIGRPGSVVHGQRNDQPDDFANQHLGSSALLDDAEDPVNAAMNAARHRSQVPRPAFPTIPFVGGMDNGFHNMHNNVWGPSPMGFVPPPGLGNPTWGGPMIPPMPPLGQIRTAGNPRSVTVRLMLCRACKELQNRNADTSDSFVDLAAIKAEVDQLSGTEVISEEDLLELAETEGNPQNGGGTFEIRRNANGPGQHSVRWVPEFNDMTHPHHRAVGAPGEIGSPITGSGTAAFLARGQ